MLHILLYTNTHQTVQKLAFGSYHRQYSTLWRNDIDEITNNINRYKHNNNKNNYTEREMLFSNRLIDKHQHTSHFKSKLQSNHLS